MKKRYKVVGGYNEADVQRDINEWAADGYEVQEFITTHTFNARMSGLFTHVLMVKIEV